MIAQIFVQALPHWHPNKAKNFCNAFFKYVKDTVTEDHDKCTYKFRKGEKTIATQILQNVNDESKYTEYSFLRDWYTARINQ